MIPLTPEQITARRVELHTVEDQLRALGRRRSTLRAEILSGYAQPEKTDARQLSLPVEDKAALDEAASEAVDEARSKDVSRAILLALEGRSQATVEGLLQVVGTQFRMTGRRPVTAEEIEDEMAALLAQGALERGDKPGWYRRPQAPQSRSKNEKAPEKAREEGPSEANLQRTILRVMLPGAWMGVASILPAVNEATGATVETAEIVRCMRDLTNAGRVEDHPTGLSWRLVPEAPKATPAKKGKATPKKAAKPARKAAGTKTAKGPPSPPNKRPDAGLKVRPLLQNWLYQRILWAGEEGASYLDICDEVYPTPFYAEELAAPLDLLLAVGLVEKQQRPGKRPRQTVSWYVARPDELGRSVDEVILDEIAGTLADAPLSALEMANSISVPVGTLTLILCDLEKQRRVTRQGDLWRLATAQDRTIPLIPDVKPAPAREEAAELCPGTAPNTPPTGRPSLPVSPSAPGAAANARASAASTHPPASP